MWERNPRKLIFHFPHAFWNVRIQTFKFFSSWCMYHLFFKTGFKIWYEIKLLKSLRKWFSILVREWRSCFFRVTQHTMGSLICHWNCIILVWNGHFDVGIDLVVVVRTMKLSKRHKNIWLWNLHYAKCLFEMGRLSCSYLRLLFKCILRFELLLPDGF